MADAFPPWKIFRTQIKQLRDFEMVYSLLLGTQYIVGLPARLFDFCHSGHKQGFIGALLVTKLSWK